MYTLVRKVVGSVWQNATPEDERLLNLMKTGDVLAHLVFVALATLFFKK